MTRLSQCLMAEEDPPVGRRVGSSDGSARYQRRRFSARSGRDDRVIACGDEPGSTRKVLGVRQPQRPGSDGMTVRATLAYQQRATQKRVNISRFAPGWRTQAKGRRPAETPMRETKLVTPESPLGAPRKSNWLAGHESSTCCETAFCAPAPGPIRCPLGGRLFDLCDQWIGVALD